MRTYQLFILITTLSIFSCGVTPKTNFTVETSTIVNLKEIPIKSINIKNEQVLIKVPLKKVQEMNNSEDALTKEYIKELIKEKSIFTFSNNLDIKNYYHKQLFEIVWNCIKSGNSNIYSIKKDKFLERIKYLTLKDSKGENEGFAIVDGDVFLKRYTIKN
jgi:hypothetical protein